MNASLGKSSAVGGVALLADVDSEIVVDVECRDEYSLVHVPHCQQSTPEQQPVSHTHIASSRSGSG